MIEDHLVLIPADDPVKLEHVREIRLDLIPGAVTTNNDVFGHQDNRSRAGEHCILNSRSLRHDDPDDQGGNHDGNDQGDKRIRVHSSRRTTENLKGREALWD